MQLAALLRQCLCQLPVPYRAGSYYPCALCRNGSPGVLCEPDAAADGAGETADGAANTLPASGDPAGGAAAGGQLLPHTYDDADLYEQLLKEYLEGAGAPGGGAATLQRVSSWSCVVMIQQPAEADHNSYGSALDFKMPSLQRAWNTQQPRLQRSVVSVQGRDISTSLKH
jgi:hypothetical protein